MRKGTRETEVVGSNSGNGRKSRTHAYSCKKNCAMDTWVATGGSVSCSSTLPYVRAQCPIHSKLKESIIGDVIWDFFRKDYPCL